MSLLKNNINFIAIFVNINSNTATYAASACMKIGIFSAFAEEPKTQTTSP